MRDALHSLVPRLDGTPDLRGAVIKLKRDVYNGRASRLHHQVLDRIGLHLETEDGLRLQSWRHLTARRSVILEELNHALAAGLEVAGDALGAAAATPDVRGGIAASSDSFYATLRASATGQWRDPARRDVRTLATYVARAAVKTSPFSSSTALISPVHS